MWCQPPSILHNRDKRFIHVELSFYRYSAHTGMDKHSICVIIFKFKGAGRLLPMATTETLIAPVQCIMYSAVDFIGNL